MKNSVSIFVIVVAIITMSFNSFSQIKDIKINDQVTINRIYAGMLTGTMFDKDNLYNTSASFTSLRFGAEATWSPNKWFYVNSYGILQLGAGAKPWHIPSFSLGFKPLKGLDICIGNQATMATYNHRPHPVSGGGQFETWTQAQVIGGATGIRAIYSIGDFKIGASAGARNHTHLNEYHLGASYKSLALTGYYNYLTKEKTAAATFAPKNGKFFGVAFAKDTMAGTFMQYNLKYVSPYLDFGYDFQNNAIPRLEFGILHPFSSKYLKGLFGLGYVYETKQIAGYIFVHL